MTVNVVDGDVVIVVVLLCAMLLVALIDVLPVVEVLGEWESLAVSLVVGLVVELAVYDGEAESLFVALTDTLGELVNVELALEDIDMEDDTDDDWLSLCVSLAVVLPVALGESEALCVALPLWLVDWEADRDELDVVERESVAVVLTLVLNDMLAESEVDEVPLGVCETDSVGVTRNVNVGDVVTVVVLLGAMLLVALIDVLPVVEVLGEGESLYV